MKRAVLIFFFIFLGEAFGGEPFSLEKQRESYEKVIFYTLSVVDDGVKIELPVVKIKDTYYGFPAKLRNGRLVRVEPKVTLVPVEGNFL